MSNKIHRNRRGVAIIVVGLVLSLFAMSQGSENESSNSAKSDEPVKIVANSNQPLAKDSLGKLAVKGRAPKAGYSRKEFGNGWATWKSCDTRQRILARDLTDIEFASDGCTVLSGRLDDPYTGKSIDFKRGAETSSAVQIDHVVALSDSWQKGAQELTAAGREQLANDDLELLASEGSANQQKSDGDAATWLPKNKTFRCQYVARQIAVKLKYNLWVTQAEQDAMTRVLESCPEQRLPSP